MFLKSLTLSNILSFGPEPHTVELGPLNVIIGPNGSGKSNFIEAIGLLKAAPTDIREPIREGGGVDEWIWRGEKRAIATVEAATEDFLDSDDVLYRLRFSSHAKRLAVREEKIFSLLDGKEEKIHFHSRDEKIILPAIDEDKSKPAIRFDHESSVLSQVRNPYDSFEVQYLSQMVSRISIYQEFDTSRGAPARVPQNADLPNAHLLPDATNLGLIISRLKRDPDTRRLLKGTLNEVYDGIEDIDVQVEGGAVQIFLHESRAAIPATRISSGTLRFLCLLAILYDPDPPPLICIEEPEIGFHPDILPVVSRLLVETSRRTQLVVTTHSDILVDTLTDRPNALLVAEKGDDGTRLTRLDAEQLKPWLENYRLGQLWTRGDLGGTRW